MAPSIALRPFFHFLSGSIAKFSATPPRWQKPILPRVAVLWDLNNNPFKEINPFDAAIRLKLAASRFGPIKFIAAYGDDPSCSIRKNKLDPDYHLCYVCGRRFYGRDKLLNHFEQIHVREQAKRVAKINSAKGGRRVRLMGDMNAKMEKFRRAAAKILDPSVVGGGIGDEIKQTGMYLKKTEIMADMETGRILDSRVGRDGMRHEIKRAGVCFRKMEIRADVAAAVESKAVGCLVVVSDDRDLAAELVAARTSGLKTVVIGDEGGELRRVADVGFSWREVACGKAGKEIGKVIVRWKDQDLLRKLEWTYRSGEE